MRVRLNLKKFILALLCVAVLPPALDSQETPDSIIRIGVLENARSFNLSCEGGLALVELNTGRKVKLSGRSSYLVTPSRDGVFIAGMNLKIPVRVMSLKGGKPIRIDGRRYRDTFILRKSPEGGIHVINELGLDGYVYGILPKEVNPAWPLQALKAQAVASRTYALHNLHRHDAEGYHLCATVHCQVYGGLDGESPQTNRAVD